MTAGLYLVARPATVEQRTARGRITAPATTAHVVCTTVPGTTWTVTDPAQLDAAADELQAAAAWLREQGERAPATSQEIHDA